MSANNLKRAYELIRDNRQDEARDILLPLCKAQPNSLDAWWLLSFALDDPARTRDALERVLHLDPHHSKARERLANLNKGRPRKSGFLNLVLIGIVGVIVAVSVIVLFLLGADDRSSGGAVVDSLPPINPQDEAVVVLTQVADARNPTPFQRSTLPPTWTPSPTSTITPSPTVTPLQLPPILPTSTPPFDPNTLPTLEPLRPSGPSANTNSQPAQVASNTEPQAATVSLSQDFLDATYWMGDGERGMEDLRIDGALRRHFYLPVKVWVGSPIDSEWEAVTHEAILAVSRVVPLERVDTEEESDIQIYFVNEDSIYETYCNPESAGCSHIDLEREKDGNYLYLESWVRIRASQDPSASLIAHELIHALGVMVHSPDSNDVMYRYRRGGDRVQLTTRDSLMLEFLYSQPALGADSARPE